MDLDSNIQRGGVRVAFGQGVVRRQTPAALLRLRFVSRLLLAVPKILVMSGCAPVLQLVQELL
jgi:hypothetical protein